ncbi:MAG: hypothetical protein WDN49_27590 [Acetobacteraceae bacterium]
MSIARGAVEQIGDERHVRRLDEPDLRQGGEALPGQCFTPRRKQLRLCRSCRHAGEAAAIQSDGRDIVPLQIRYGHAVLRVGDQDDLDAFIELELSKCCGVFRGHQNEVP